MLPDASHKKMHRQVITWILRGLYAFLVIYFIGVLAMVYWSNDGRYPNIVPMLVAILLIFLIKQGKSMTEFKQRYQDGDHNF
ncbi:hypothetical protein [Moraxella sp.]|uniref:hypothetical protein n=1 Tax=Moraxella sp. TaxID=479 RepID=UPI0026DC7625|nr:hypothetical protein [Moraxella sp.]MDO4895683.1 hypothetical protein [Moraxella sp.]